MFALGRRRARWSALANDAGAAAVARRALLYLLFALAVFGLAYRPALAQHPFVDLGYVVEGTLQAANEGHPFMAYTALEPRRLVHFDEFAGGRFDPGLPLLISTTALVGRALVGSELIVDDTAVYHLLFALFLVTGLLFVFPGVPLSIAAGGLLVLGVAVVAGPAGDSGFYAKWGATYGAILAGMRVATAPLPRADRPGLVFFIGLSLLAGFAQFLRNESALMVHAVCAVMASGAWTLAILAWSARQQATVPGLGDSEPATSYPRKTERGGMLCPTARPGAANGSMLRAARVGSLVPWASQVTLVALCFAGVTWLAPHALRGAYALAWGQPYGDTRLTLHGGEHALYLGLGYVPNPYNIVWRDQVGRVHGKLIDPTARVEDVRYGEVLRAEWLRVVRESPWLLLENVSAKAASLAPMQPGQSAALLPMLLLALGVRGLCLALAIRQWKATLVLTTLGFCTLLLVSAAPLLLIHPDYVNGLQGAVLAAIILPLATARAGAGRRVSVGDRETPGKLLYPRRTLAMGAVVLVAGTLSASVWYLHRAQLHAQQQIAFASADPGAEVARLQYRFGHEFNALSVPQQEVVLDRLRGSSGRTMVAKRPDRTAGQDHFRPVLVVQTPGQLHVVAWFGRHELALRLRIPGSSSYLLRICLECDAFATYQKNDLYDFVDERVDRGVLPIHDGDWQDRYWWLSFPVESQRAAVRFVCVGLQEVTGVAQRGFWYTLDTVATSCLEPNGGD